MIAIEHYFRLENAAVSRGGMNVDKCNARKHLRIHQLKKKSLIRLKKKMGKPQ